MACIFEYYTGGVFVEYLSVWVVCFFTFRFMLCTLFILLKGSGGDGIPVELFQILKDDAMKVLHSICQ